MMRKTLMTILAIKLFVLTFLITSFKPAYAQQDTLSVATYNILKFPGSNGADRLDHFRKVIQHMKPDILVVQELETQAGLLSFLNSVMNVNENIYEGAPFSDGPDTDSGLFYNRNKVSLLGLNAIRTSLRDVMEYTLLAFGQEFIILSAHLKAGSSNTDQQIRFNQATLLRNHTNGYPANTNFMMVGDFNMRSASENAFVRLTEEQADNDGRLFDPINQIGNWHNNSFFILTHSQSTRTTAFGDGATGGLDDRFDMILVSEKLLGSGGIMVLPSSYHALGNDGNHFNQAINSGANLAVPDSVADGLHEASDHLPVISKFVFGTPTAVSDPEQTPGAFTLEQNFPNPFNPTTTIRFSLASSARVTLEIFNLLGQRVDLLVDEFRKAGEYSVEFEANNLNSGVYVYRLQARETILTKKLLLLK